MIELVQITAQYSNAVLVAVMPYLTDFAQKLNLPLQTPITPAMVQHFKCDVRKGHVGGLVTLTNLTQFTFLDGRVCIYRSPRSYYSLQDPDRIPEFYGTVKIKDEEAIKVAHGIIAKLGYTDSMFHAENPPKITPPEKIRFHVVPRYLVQWLDPDWKGSKTIVPAKLTVEVNASDGLIEMVTMSSHLTERPGPKVDVEPPLRQATSPSGPEPGKGSNTEPVSKEFSRAFLAAILPQVSEFIPKAGLPIPVPVGTNQLDMSQFSCAIYQGQPIVQLYLTNGDRFNYEHGHVVVFDAHDAFCHNQKAGRVEDFLGKQNMSTNDAVALARSVFEKLGYKGKQPRIYFYDLDYVGGQVFTRYTIHFLRRWDNSEIATFEIDLADKAIKFIHIDDPSLYRDPPEVGVPIEPTSPEQLAKWRSEFVHMTPQYSNAVLLAVMPHLTDFTRKLNLPLPTPITPAMVRHFKCDRRKGQVGGEVTLTNLAQFTFLDGRVCDYRSPRSLYSCQDIERLPQFYGTVKIKEKAALKTARDLIAKLGYTESMFHAENQPKITPPERLGFHVIARYLIQWPAPDAKGSTTDVPAMLTVEVNASDGRIEMMTIGADVGQRPAPKVDVEPPVRAGTD